MQRLIILVEGETEESFVQEVLYPYLLDVGVSTSARMMGNARLRARRGGIRPWHQVANDIEVKLKSDATCFVTTMVDYYGLPAVGSGAWPGRELANSRAYSEKALVVQEALHSEVQNRMGAEFNGERFLPYVVMHEFEGLLFSDCEQLAGCLSKPSIQPQLKVIRDNFISPEEINDSPITAPSKRIVELIPEYQKPIMGTYAMLCIGLDKIRSECPFFNSWLCTLETLDEA